MKRSAASLENLYSGSYFICLSKQVIHTSGELRVSIRHLTLTRDTLKLNQRDRCPLHRYYIPFPINLNLGMHDFGKSVQYTLLGQQKVLLYSFCSNGTVMRMNGSMHVVVG